MSKVKMIAVLSALKVILNMKFETDYATNGKGCVIYLFQNHACAVYSDLCSTGAFRDSGVGAGAGAGLGNF